MIFDKWVLESCHELGTFNYAEVYNFMREALTVDGQNPHRRKRTPSRDEVSRKLRYFHAKGALDLVANGQPRIYRYIPPANRVYRLPVEEVLGL
jgi:hypothetical protein